MPPPRCCWALLLLCTPAAGGLLGFGTPPQEGGAPPQGPPSPPGVPFEMATGDKRFQAEGAQWELSPLDSCHRQVRPRGSPWLGYGGDPGDPPTLGSHPGVPWGKTIPFILILG